MANTWFRLYHDFLDDEKILSIAFEDQRHFVGVLILKSSGILDKVSDMALLDKIVGQKLWIEMAAIPEVKKRLMSVGLIGEDWSPLAWDKRQRRSDFDPTATDRKRKERLRKQQLSSDRNDVTEESRVTSRSALYTDTDTDTDTEEEDIPKQPAVLPPNRRRGTVDGTPYKEIVSTYHDVLPELPRVAKLTETRKTHIRARHGKDFPTLEDWREYFGYVRESKFLMGFSGGERKFKAGFDFLIRESSAVNICEGKYHD